MPITEALALHSGVDEVLVEYHTGYSLNPSRDNSLHDGIMECDEGLLSLSEEGAELAPLPSIQDI